MDELIKYLDGKLNAIKFIKLNEEKASLRAQYMRSDFDAAFGAVEYFYFANWQNNPDLAQKADDLWTEKYGPEFEKLIYGA